MKALRIALFTLCALTALNGFATPEQGPLKKWDLSPERVRQIQDLHQQLNHAPKALTPPIVIAPARPFSEVETAGYLFFSVDNNFSSEAAKRLMAQNLPAGVTLVIYGSPGQDRADVLREYDGLIDPTRVKVIALNNTWRGFWTRDALPIPVFNADGGMNLIDSKYYHGFEPDAELGAMFQSVVVRNSYYFEGGNFMVNDRGDCLTVDNDLSSDIPDSVFRDTYGCQRLLRFPHVKGIGHMDETVRFLSSNSVVTDNVSYARVLEQNGFEVHMLPRPDGDYETYVNALLVNGTVYVPVFNESQDQEALDVYRAAGLTVVPVPSSSLSNDGLGSVHCITMTYPKVPFSMLLEKLGAKEI